MNRQPPVCKHNTVIYLLLATTCMTSAIPIPSGHHNSLTFSEKFWKSEPEDSKAMETAPGPMVGAGVIQADLSQRGHLYKEPSKNKKNQMFDFTIKQKWKKHGRQQGFLGYQRQIQSQLMRVGCVLGTCQVQNLSYRLYQIVGQRRRQQPSPVNPRSPHSYG